MCFLTAVTVYTDGFIIVMPIWSNEVKYKNLILTDLCSTNKKNMVCTVSLPSTEAGMVSVRLQWTPSWSSLLPLGIGKVAELTVSLLDAVVLKGGVQRGILVIPSDSSSRR